MSYSTKQSRKNLSLFGFWFNLLVNSLVVSLPGGKLTSNKWRVISGQSVLTLGELDTDIKTNLRVQF